MNSRRRASFTGLRLGGALKADERPDERVIVSMGGVGIIPGEEQVEALLRGGIVFEIPYPIRRSRGSPDRDEQRRHGLRAAREVGDPGANEILSWQ